MMPSRSSPPNVWPWCAKTSSGVLVIACPSLEGLRIAADLRPPPVCALRRPCPGEPVPNAVGSEATTTTWSDPDHHVEGMANLRLRDILDHRPHLVLMKPNRLHGASPGSDHVVVVASEPTAFGTGSPGPV